jgi:hypothetical protein
MSFHVFSLSFQSSISCPERLSHPVRRASLLALSAGTIQAIALSPASADIIPLNLATEVMIEDTASNNLIVGALFDPSKNSKLSYNTVMAADGSYTYGTVAGSMLDGTPISLTGSGTASSTGPRLGNGLPPKKVTITDRPIGPSLTWKPSRWIKTASISSHRITITTTRMATKREIFTSSWSLTQTSQ